MRRRLFVNLTPLLDLVLLVIFAYQIRSSLWVAQSATTAKNEEEIRRETEDAAQKLVKKNEELRAELEELREKNRSLEERTQRVANGLHDLLRDVPEQDFYRALAGANQEDVRRVQEFLDRAPAGEVLLRRLARVESYQRHITSWMVHLRDEYALEIRSNDGPIGRVTLSSNEAEARNRLAKALRELEEPKDLVIVFFSWGRLLKVQKDLVDDVLEVLARDTFRIQYPNKRFHVTREGYRGE